MRKRSEVPAKHAQILLEIEARFGIVTPKMVVDLAKDEGHPLHPYFEWRDDVAAQRFREEQARELIRNARLDIVVSEVPLSAHAFIRDPTVTANEQGYRSITSFAADRIAATEALAAEIRAAAALLRRARDIAQSLGLPADDLDASAKSVEDQATRLINVATEAAA